MMTKIPYIVFTGSHSCGKTSSITSLIPHLKRMYDYPIYHITEVSRKLNKELGVSINKEGTNITQKLIESTYKKEEDLHDKEVRIADRSIIDRFAYMITSKAAEDFSLIQWYKDNIKSTCDKYSHIFYLPVVDEIKLSLDGVRSSDEEYRKEIDKIIKETIKNYNIKVYTLVGNIEQRVNQIIEVLND